MQMEMREFHFRFLSIMASRYSTEATLVSVSHLKVKGSDKKIDREEENGHSKRLHVLRFKPASIEEL